MALNPYFLHGSQSEQGLVQDLINEHIRMFGLDVQYIPRKYIKTDNIIREVQLSAFDDNFTIEIKYDLNNFCQLQDRKDLSIDDDMMYVYLTIKENKVKYYIERFRLKKIEDMDTKRPSIYHKGDYEDYDWEVFSYTYEI